MQQGMESNSRHELEERMREEMLVDSIDKITTLLATGAFKTMYIHPNIRETLLLMLDMGAQKIDIAKIRVFESTHLPPSKLLLEFHSGGYHTVDLDDERVYF